MYAIMGKYDKLEDRPNIEIIFFDDDLEEVKKVYAELTKENPDIQGIGMMGVNTENLEELEIIGIHKCEVIG